MSNWLAEIKTKNGDKLDPAELLRIQRENRYLGIYCPEDYGYDYDDIVVEIDGQQFTNQDFTYIQQLAEILDATDLLAEFNQPGEQFELGNLKITIQHIQTYEKDLIVCKK